MNTKIKPEDIIEAEFEEVTNVVPDTWEDDEDTYEDDSPAPIEDYKLPESKKAVVNTATGEQLKPENLTPWQVIEAMAHTMNVKIRKPNSSCKHCLGKGYVGLETNTKSPVPCRCIYPPTTVAEQQKINDADYKYRVAGMNRQQKRYAAKQMAKGNKKQLRKVFEYGTED